MLMLDVRISYFSFKDVLPVNHAECFCCIFSIWYIFILSSFHKYLLSAFHLSSIVKIKGKKTHMVPTILKYGGFQFHSRWSKPTTTSFSLLTTQN